MGVSLLLLPFTICLRLGREKHCLFQAAGPRAGSLPQFLEKQGVSPWRPAQAVLSGKAGWPWRQDTASFPCSPAEKQRELARKGSLKNGSMGSPVNQQPKKNNVMARTRLVVPNKGYSSLDQSPDEKPLVALDTDSDDDFDMSRYSSSGYSSAEINQDLNIQLLKDGYRLDEIPDDEDLDLIPPKSVNPTCMCCQATSSTACHIQ
ncbi:PREDICTED: protein FAM219A isoform X2 [Capra hircus]|uniref:protein FAM219A isoform X2 n=1 Tax=Capra hircus TaxID=9925 RepID=UPI00084777B5|nr:PREDICTED: protein FAM219A isoform X2 [Capra hircus]